MWRERRVSAVVPAYCEERLVGSTLASIPSFVDRIVVVDDCSPDGTSRAVLAAGDDRVILERHAMNRGVGAAIATGYRRALREGTDVMVVMAADGQMDPADLSALLEPVIDGRADYVKGNRFVHPEARRMPLARRFGSAALSSWTRLLLGLDVDDTQCGYTALSADAARRLALDELWPRYGYPNDLLGLLAEQGLRVGEVPVRPVYAGEASGLRPWHVPLIAAVVLRRAWRSRTLTRRGRG